MLKSVQVNEVSEPADGDLGQCGEKETFLFTSESVGVGHPGKIFYFLRISLGEGKGERDFRIFKV